MPQEQEEFDPTSIHSMHKVGRCDEWHDAKVQVTQMKLVRSCRLTICANAFCP